MIPLSHIDGISQIIVRDWWIAVLMFGALLAWIIWMIRDASK